MPTPYRHSDPASGITPLWAYVFLAVSGDVTLSGWFVDAAGLQITELQEFTVSTDPVTFEMLYGDFLPENALGFEGAVTGGAIYAGKGAAADGTIPEEMVPADGYPQIAETTYKAFGRV